MAKLDIVGNEDLKLAKIEKIKAETVRIEAEAAIGKAQLAMIRAEAETARHMAESARIARDEAIRNENWVTQSDIHNHVFNFDAPVVDETKSLCINFLSHWDRADRNCPMVVRFCSPGGDVISGLALFDFLCQMAKTHELTTEISGMAASMAGFLAQSASDGCRLIGSESTLHIHEPTTGMFGKPSEIEDITGWNKNVCERMVRVYTKRSNMTAVVFQKKWRGKEWYIDSDEALKLGFVDKVI